MTAATARDHNPSPTVRPSVRARLRASGHTLISSGTDGRSPCVAKPRRATRGHYAAARVACRASRIRDPLTKEAEN